MKGFVDSVLKLCGLAALGALGAAGFVWSGWYDISANVQHTQPVYSLLEKTMHQSVQRRAAAIQPPALGDERQLARGAACYVDKCVQCHGGPGVAQAEIGRSMQPLPGPLVDASAKWRAAELYWITRNGIKMSGMPAWQHRLSDDDLWAVVAFMQRLPVLTAAEFRGFATVAATAGLADSVAAAPATSCRALPSGGSAGDSLLPARPADAERGRIAMTQYACNACHRVPGITGSAVDVGPPLGGMARRQLIAGAVPNTREQMVRWLRDPRSIDPETTMPAMQVAEQDAHDMAAYLATLD